MSHIAMEAARLIDMLPEADQSFAFEFVKRMVLAWDPDYTKFTAAEEEELNAAEESGFVDEKDIDWSKIGR